MGAVLFDAFSPCVGLPSAEENPNRDRALERADDKRCEGEDG